MFHCLSLEQAFVRRLYYNNWKIIVLPPLMAIYDHGKFLFRITTEHAWDLSCQRFGA